MSAVEPRPGESIQSIPVAGFRRASPRPPTFPGSKLFTHQNLDLGPKTIRTRSVHDDRGRASAPRRGVGGGTTRFEVGPSRGSLDPDTDKSVRDSHTPASAHIERLGPPPFRRHTLDFAGQADRD